MSTCNRLDLQTLGSQPIMPKNLPHHWIHRRMYSAIQCILADDADDLGNIMGIYDGSSPPFFLTPKLIACATI